MFITTAYEKSERARHRELRAQRLAPGAHQEPSSLRSAT
jgi:hypothetical protein